MTTTTEKDEMRTAQMLTKWQHRVPADSFNHQRSAQYCGSLEMDYIKSGESRPAARSRHPRAPTEAAQLVKKAFQLEDAWGPKPDGSTKLGVIP